MALYNHFHDLAMKAICQNEIFFFKVSINGIELFLELTYDQMKCHLFIDLLVKSSKSKSKTFRFIDEHVSSQIEHLCSVAQVGCQGVTLVQRILRPQVVQNFLLYKNRKDPTISVEELKQELLGTNLDLSYVHP